MHPFDQSASEPTHPKGTTIMTTLAHAQDAGIKANRFTIGSDARATAYVMAIIGAGAIFVRLLRRAHFAPSAGTM
jgi:hypothetical protein